MSNKLFLEEVMSFGKFYQEKNIRVREDVSRYNLWCFEGKVSNEVLFVLVSHLYPNEGLRRS